VVHVRSSKPAAWSGRAAQAKSARRAWSDFMMPQPDHKSGGSGRRRWRTPASRCRKQRAGWFGFACGS
jgi:hypothetical protein